MDNRNQIWWLPVFGAAFMFVAIWCFALASWSLPPWEAWRVVAAVVMFCTVFAGALWLYLWYDDTH